MNNNINLNILRNLQAGLKPSFHPAQNVKPAPVPQAAAPQVQQTSTTDMPQNIQTPQMAGSENATFIRNAMNLPQNFNALVYSMQNNMNNAQLQMHLKGQLIMGNTLSSSQAQILAQLQGLGGTFSMSEVSEINKTMLSQLEAAMKKLPITASGMINIADIAALIKANGKDAITQIIIGMANAAKNGVTDVSQMKDAARFINACVSLAGQKDNAQTLKLLMLLYLPWLPLQQGVDFELEIKGKDEEENEQSVLVVTIDTVHYGRVITTLTLVDSASVDVVISCSESFPKDELTLRLNSDTGSYCAKTNFSYSTNSNSANIAAEKSQATINMSNTNEINPYLLLTAHQIIREVVSIDKSQ